LEGGVQKLNRTDRGETKGGGNAHPFKLQRATSNKKKAGEKRGKKEEEKKMQKKRNDARKRVVVGKGSKRAKGEY